MLSSTKRIIANLALVLSILSLGFMLVFQSSINTIMSELLFYLILLFLLVLFFSLLLIRLPTQDKTSKFSNLRLGRFWSFILVSLAIGSYFFALFFDLFISNSMYYSTIMLMAGLVISFVLTRHSYRLALSFMLFLFILHLFAVYAFYPPSLGNDTWRDVGSALITMRQGSIGGMTNSAYQIPIVPLTYSMLSIALGIDPVYASAVVGALYIVIAAVFALLISKRLNNKINTPSSFFVVLLVLSIPLISLWSVAFIPQAYTFVSFLALLLVSFGNTTSKAAGILLVLPLILVIALTHGGAALWVIGFLASLIIAMRFNGRKPDVAYFFIKRSLLVLSLVSAVYFSYTTLFSSIRNGIQSVINALFNTITLTQEPATFAISNSSPPFVTALFCYGPLIVSVALSTVAWLANKRSHRLNDVFVETVFVYGTIMLAVGLMGTVFFSDACLDRYLGFGSLLLLSIIAAIGFDVFIKRGYIGKVFVGGLTVLLILSVGFGAILTPDFNPFNVHSSYSIQSVLSYDEFGSSNSITDLINDRSILTDLRTGASLSYETIAKHDGQVTVVKLGVYGFVLKYSYFVDFLNQGGFFVYRPFSLDELNVLQDISEFELHFLMVSQYNFIYSGPINVFCKN